jgi:4-hydroxy-tetrahydrodipicolinate reductase
MSSGVFFLLVFLLKGMRSFIVVEDWHLVMGTTGGDWNKLVKDVEASGVYAVIAPQMRKQVGVCDDVSAGLRHNSMCK